MNAAIAAYSGSAQIVLGRTQRFWLIKTKPSYNVELNRVPKTVLFFPLSNLDAENELGRIENNKSTRIVRKITTAKFKFS